MAILTCRDMSFAYDGKTVLEGVNFSLSAGDYLCVVGENGSGKSTLIKGLLGLKAPASGELILGDGLRETEIGYLPQQTQVQRDFPASVREVVLSGCLNSLGGRLFYSKADREHVQMNMERMGRACRHELSRAVRRPAAASPSRPRAVRDEKAPAARRAGDGA